VRSSVAPGRLSNQGAVVAGVGSILERPWLPVLLLLAGLAPAYAGRAPEPPTVDAIERASGAGDAALALQLSSELLAHPGAASSARVAAIEARMDAIFDAGEWAKHSDAVREAIAALPDPQVRAALEISFAANAVSGPGTQVALLDAAPRHREELRPARHVPCRNARGRGARAGCTGQA